MCVYVVQAKTHYVVCSLYMYMLYMHDRSIKDSFYVIFINFINQVHCVCTLYVSEAIGCAACYVVCCACLLNDSIISIDPGTLVIFFSTRGGN